ncbi:polyketide cyclase/dehydrase and lipid transporter [Coniochaeta sp. 2T2.1]|nr:polyketide cyclase/dehydrase and lipid transporter [Coniochaeta sp. 2T2.1]
MASTRLAGFSPLRPLLSKPLSHFSPLTTPQTRHFSLPDLSTLSSSLNPKPQTISASRQLPYPSRLLYSIISDIDSYATFLPFCNSSVVHSHTPSTPRLPSLATLTVGWGPFPSESYTSRVYCVPGRTVEAVSGEAGPSTGWDVLRKYGYEREIQDGVGKRREGDGELFRSLVTKWSVTPVGGEEGRKTEVDLRIEYLMNNPLHQVAVSGVADQVADKMIRAFERRAERTYGEWKRKEAERQGR